MVLLPLAAAVLLLAMPGTRAVGAGFVGGLSGGFLLGAVGARARSSGPPASPSDEFGGVPTPDPAGDLAW